MNNFAYGQTLLIYEEDEKKIKDKFGKTLIVELEGATTRTCKNSKQLLDKCLQKMGECKIHLILPI